MRHRSTCAGSSSANATAGARSRPFLAKYELDDPALVRIAEIVHDADLEDERYGAPEARGLGAALRGLSLVCDDHEMIATAAAVFDGLYVLLGEPDSPAPG